MEKTHTKEPRLRLNKTDILIFYFLFEYRIISTEQFCCFFEKPFKSDGGTARRLLRLERAGYILNPDQAPSRQIYVLGNLGADYLRKEYRGIMPKTGSWDMCQSQSKKGPVNRSKKGPRRTLRWRTMASERSQQLTLAKARLSAASFECACRVVVGLMLGLNVFTMFQSEAITVHFQNMHVMC